MSKIVENLEKLLAAGPETPLLHFGIANAVVNSDPHKAITHLERALVLDENYSAAWKLLGKTLTGIDNSRAIEVFEQGIRVADNNGDVQAGKEMNVFLKRARKARDENN
ncbi:MAG: hypothetical protein AAF384_01550 [Pseudomonadota bacterium]